MNEKWFEKWFSCIFNVWVLAVALLSIPQFLRGDFLIESSLGGIMFAFVQWMALALAILIVLNLVISRFQGSEQKEAEG